MTTHQRTICPDCRCKLLKLRDFEGVSSRDAPRFDDYDSSAVRLWGLWIFVFSLLKNLWRGGDETKRRRKAKQLRDEILPEYPKSVICPDCFEVDKRN